MSNFPKEKLTDSVLFHLLLMPGLSTVCYIWRPICGPVRCGQSEKGHVVQSWPLPGCILLGNLSWAPVEICLIRAPA